MSSYAAGLIGGLCVGFLAGWTACIVFDWITYHLEERRRRRDFDDTLERLRRL